MPWTAGAPLKPFPVASFVLCADKQILGSACTICFVSMCKHPGRPVLSQLPGHPQHPTAGTTRSAGTQPWRLAEVCISQRLKLSELALASGLTQVPLQFRGSMKTTPAACDRSAHKAHLAPAYEVLKGLKIAAKHALSNPCVAAICSLRGMSAATCSAKSCNLQCHKL